MNRIPSLMGSRNHANSGTAYPNGTAICDNEWTPGNHTNPGIAYPNFPRNTDGSRLGLQSTGSAYPQETQIGAAFDNCASTVNVTQHFSGSVTITIIGAWVLAPDSSCPSPSRSLYRHLLDMEKEVTMEQSYDYQVPPKARAVLVGTASFDAIFGNMNMKYSNYNTDLNNVVYFKSDANQNPVVALRMFGCNEPFPTWNATAATAASGDGRIAHYTPRRLIISTLVLLALLI
ncbi:hypothetical protein B0H13DRAFT_1879418 [Mycena leptocephala]|nr:hypothetical protein B0H13DRAFT_1879418 [Mycena leptocephala]